MREELFMRECPFGENRDGVNEFPIGMTYVPWQKNVVTYEHLEDGFCNGTIFPELYMPFTGRRCVR